MSRLEIRRDMVILACAVSAGIHGALVRRHFREGAGAAAVLFGLLLSYVAARTTGLPVVHPEPEPAYGLALATKATEAVGLVAAATLLRRPSVAPALTRAKGTLT